MKTIRMIMYGPMVSVVMCSNGLVLLQICSCSHGYATTIHCHAAIIFILKFCIVICAVLLLCTVL